MFFFAGTHQQDSKPNPPPWNPHFSNVKVRTSIFLAKSKMVSKVFFIKPFPDWVPGGQSPIRNKRVSTEGRVCPKCFL